MALILLENRGFAELPANLSEISGWKPINSAQATFLECRAQMALYGGASGGGKTNVLVADSAQEHDNPSFRGILLRKSYTEMTNIMEVRREALFTSIVAEDDDTSLATFRELARNLGIYGFGAAAHLLAQVANHEGRRVFAFTRAGDSAGQRFARELGAVWAGSSAGGAPELLDAAILFAPVGELIPAALAAVRPGGRVVCAGIHMSDVPAFPYRLLWGERSVSSVANLTRADGEEFLALAARLRLKPTVERFALADANLALGRLRSGTLRGAAVLEPAHN